MSSLQNVAESPFLVNPVSLSPLATGLCLSPLEGGLSPLAGFAQNPTPFAEPRRVPAPVETAAPTVSYWDELQAKTEAVLEFLRIVANSNPQKLPSKKQDLSEWFADANLTDRQMECSSLYWEFGLSDAEIARRLGITRKTVYEHREAARRKINEARSRDSRAKRRAKSGIW